MQIRRINNPLIALLLVLFLTDPQLVPGQTRGTPSPSPQSPATAKVSQAAPAPSTMRPAIAPLPADGSPDVLTLSPIARPAIAPITASVSLVAPAIAPTVQATSLTAPATRPTLAPSPRAAG